jgi:CubicO group peptidase (beta-lactamase class C family)
MGVPAGFEDSVLARIDEVVGQAVAEGQAPGVVAAVARGDTVHVVTAGATAVGGPPMRRDTLFRITSNTKPMTAAAVLSLVDDGLLKLNGAVDDLLPELADRRVLSRPDGLLTDTVPARRPITVRDLLTFTWGFGMQGAMFMAADPWPVVVAAAERQLATFGPPQPASTPDPDTWIARLGELPLLAQPGERWLYQSGSQVLGVLAARAAGAPFEDVLRSRVFGPLGMDDTGFHAADTARLSTAYERRDGKLVVTDPPEGQWSQPPAFPDGGAGLVSVGRRHGRVRPHAAARWQPCPEADDGRRDDPRSADPGAAGQRLARLQLPRGPGLGLRRVGARRRPLHLGGRVRDGVVERAVTGPHRRGAHPADRRRDRDARHL